MKPQLLLEKYFVTELKIRGGLMFVMIDKIKSIRDVLEVKRTIAD